LIVVNVGFGVFGFEYDEYGHYSRTSPGRRSAFDPPNE
jgi:hypothetical protein